MLTSCWTRMSLNSPIPVDLQYWQSNQPLVPVGKEHVCPVQIPMAGHANFTQLFSGTNKLGRETRAVQPGHCFLSSLPGQDLRAIKFYLGFHCFLPEMLYKQLSLIKLILRNAIVWFFCHSSDIIKNPILKNDLEGAKLGSLLPAKQIKQLEAKYLCNEVVRACSWMSSYLSYICNIPPWSCLLNGTAAERYFAAPVVVYILQAHMFAQFSWQEMESLSSFLKPTDLQNTATAFTQVHILTLGEEGYCSKNSDRPRNSMLRGKNPTHPQRS